MIKLDIDVSNIRSVLHNRLKEDHNLLKKVHKEHIDDIKELSQKYVDVDSGRLKDSMQYEIYNEAGKMVGIVSYNTLYALDVHERPRRAKKGTKRRYLHSAFKEATDSKKALLEEVL